MSCRHLTFLFLVVCFTTSSATAQRLRVVQRDRTLSGHADTVTCLAFFPDSVRLVSGGRDRTVKVWDALTGRLLRTLKGHEGPVYSVAVSGDGKWVASGSSDHTVRVWDVSNGDQIAQLEGHRGSVRCLAFLPDGTLLSGGLEGLRRWDVKEEKLLWKVKAQFNVDALVASADGTRVALTDDSGTSFVWDVKNGKKLAEFGQSRLQPLCIAMSPDGKQVFYQSGDQTDIHRWDVDANRELDLPSAFGSPDAVAFSPDGKRVFRAGERVAVGQGYAVLDTAKYQPVFELALRLFEPSNCVAVSPDGKRVAYGSGGRREGPVRWQPGRQNLIVVFSLPESDEPHAGPPAGQVSWDVVPARLRSKEGRDIPLTGRFWPSEVPMDPQPRVKQLCPGLDVVCMAGAILLHREKGVLDEVLVDEKAGYSDAVWDGLHIWVASQAGGVRILDREGKPVASISAAEGLGSAGSSVVIAVLGPGRVLVAGVPRPPEPKPGATPAATLTGGWCSVIVYDGQSPPRVKPLFTEAQLAGWPQAAKGQPAFIPLCIIRPNVPLTMKPGDKASDELWIVCRSVGSVMQPVVRVNAKTLAFEPYNVEPADPKFRYPPPFMKQSPTYLTPWWRSNREILCSGDVTIYRCMVTDTAVDTSHEKLVCERPVYYGDSDFLSTGGKLYLPGTHWFSIDPRTLFAQDIGPGLRVNGELVRDNIYYFNSGHFGLAALSVMDGCFYQFSVDPAHPLSVRGTLDPPVASRPAPAEGAIDRAGSSVTFSCGNGSMTFDEVRPRQVIIQYPAQLSHFNEYLWLLDRVRDRPEERERVGISEQQLQQVNELRKHTPLGRPDTAPFVKMFEATRSAPDDAAKDKAVAALFEAIRQLGDAQVKETEGFFKQIRGVFTDRQWRMLHYEEPPPKD